MSAIRIEGLSKFFGTTHAVGPLNLEIGSGELLSLLGPSGCGKTTTLRMVAGLEVPSQGSIWIGDRLVDNVPIERRDIGMVFQSYALFPHLTIFENVAFGLRLRKMTPQQIKERVRANLDLVGLSGFADRMPSQLSGGQQQRVSLARALAVRPSVLLFDEPLSNLDQKLREQMRDEIRRLQRQVGITAIYVTHDQSEAMAISDRVAVLNKGHVEQIASPREIYHRPRTLFVAQFIGQCSIFLGYLSGRFFISRGGLEFAINGEAPSAMHQSELALVIRPESVLLGNADGTDASYTGVVDEVVYLGDKAAVKLRMSPTGEVLLADLRPEYGESLPQVGANVPIRIRTDQAVIVPVRCANQ